jgi:hypothetical protein
MLSAAIGYTTSERKACAANARAALIDFQLVVDELAVSVRLIHLKKASPESIQR